MSTSVEFGFISVIVIILLTTEDCTALTCYDCTNLEMASDSSSMIRSFFSGKSDSSCGSNPSRSNSKICPTGNICGAITGDLSADIPLIGRLHAKMQIRTCIKGEVQGVMGECHKPDQSTLSGVQGVLGILVKLESGIDNLKLDGMVCGCASDFCVPDCEDGVSISGICIKYWMIGVSAAGVFILFCLLIVLMRCCCCRRSIPGRIIYIPASQVNCTPLVEVSVGQGQIQGCSNPMYNHVK